MIWHLMQFRIRPSQPLLHIYSVDGKSIEYLIELGMDIELKDLFRMNNFFKFLSFDKY